MLNMVVVDPKPISVGKNTKNNSGKLETEFAKKLDVATDKIVVDADSKGKNDDNAQLMAAMAGMIIPPVIVNPVPVNQVETGGLAGIAEGEANVQAASTVPNESQPQLALVVAGGVSQDKLQDPVAVKVPSPSQDLATSVVPSKTDKTPVASIIPNSSQVQVASVMPSSIAQEQLTNVVATQVNPKGQLDADLKPDMNATQGQLATVVGKMTAVDPQVATNQIAEVVKMQNQISNQDQLQDKSTLGQNQVTEVVAQNTDTLLSNSILSKLVPTASQPANSNGLGKNSGKQIDGKKIGENQVNIQATEVNDLFGGVEELTVKPVLTSQVTATVLDTVLSEQKETGDTILPNTTLKDPNAFATLLNQQGMKIESQTKAEMNPTSSQPMADPYNITSQIVDQARLVAGAKNTEMIIQLKPEHLGELTFKVSVENGVVSASFHSNNSEVRNIIESSLYQLKQEMSNQGLKVDNVGVYAGLGEFFSNGQQSKGNQQSSAKVQNKKTEEDFLEAFEATDSAGKVLSATGVDYRA